MNSSKKENSSLIKIKRQKIKIILRQNKNNECFECLNLNPEYISLNNGIFLCKNCAKKHENFPKYISNIFKNELDKLTLKNIQYLYFGGNENLRNFVNNEFPKLKKFSYQNFYLSYSMDYYRKYLEYLIEGGIKPSKPNKNKAYELIQIFNNNYSNKNNNLDIFLKNKNNNDIERNNVTEKKIKYQNGAKNEIIKLFNSPNNHRSNIHLLISNLSDSLNNFNTINIYNYNNIYSNTFYKKRFFSPILHKDNLDEIQEKNNLTDINNMTFNKEENIEKKNDNLNLEYKKKKENKFDTNIKVVKRKNFLDNKFINDYDAKANIYAKPLSQNYFNNFSKKKNNKIFSKYIDLSSDLKYISNDNIENIQKINKNIIYPTKSLLNHNLNSSKKMFKKKTIGHSFSIHNKDHKIISANNSIEKIKFFQKEKFINFNAKPINKNFIKENKNELTEKIKVNINMNNFKKRKRHSLGDIIINGKDKQKNMKNLSEAHNIQKLKIIERIHRVTSNNKGKNIFLIENGNKNEKLNIIKNKDNIEENNNNIIKKGNKLIIKNNNLMNQSLNNKHWIIKKNILEVNTYNLSNLIISPNSKKIGSFYTQPKAYIKKEFTNKIK